MRRGVVIAALGSAQTLAWGSSYYLPAILDRMGISSVGVSASLEIAAFAALLFLKAHSEAAAVA